MIFHYLSTFLLFFATGLWNQVHVYFVHVSLQVFALTSLSHCLNMSTEITQIPLSAKILFYLLPTIGLCFAFLDMAVLIRRRLNAYPIAYHEWLFSFSQFSFWVSSNFPKVMEMSKLKLSSSTLEMNFCFLAVTNFRL